MLDYSPQKTFCPECRTEVEYQIKNLVEEKEVRGLEFEYTAERAYCNNCGSEIFIAELHDKNLQKIDNAYREKQEISEIWRDYKMVKILKYAEEQGEKKGEKKGRT